MKEDKKRKKVEVKETKKERKETEKLQVEEQKVSTNTSYVALLRGVKVSGKNLIKMKELQEAMIAASFTNVRTYIQSGNVLFTASEQTDPSELAERLATVISDRWGFLVGVVVFPYSRWRQIITEAPNTWGKGDPNLRHNILVCMKTSDMEPTLAAIAKLKGDSYGHLVKGEGIIYQTVPKTAKWHGSSSFKQVTIRKYTTATKLLHLLKETMES